MEPGPKLLNMKISPDVIIINQEESKKKSIRILNPISQINL